MSSLLDEAIVDAKALREAVLKNAEASLLEAYAPKIEEAVTNLLEQDPGMAPGGAPGVGPLDVGAPPVDIGAPPGGLGAAPEGPEGPEETEDIFSTGEEEAGIGDIPFASLTELDDDSSLLDEEEIDITYGELHEMLESITKDIETLEEEMEEDLEIDEELLQTLGGHGDGGCPEDDGEEDIAFELSEDNIDEIVESLVVDIMPTKSGWAGTPESVMQYNEKLIAARAQDTENKQEIKDLLDVGRQLAESNKKFKTSNTKLRSVVNILKEKLEEINLTNAKLLYTNRILRKSSLNERQKTKIVEALSNAGSVNEAKVLYETLQNAVGSSRKEGPKSLSEAVSRPSTMLPRRKSQNNDSNPFADRMKILAGINHK